MSSRSRRSWPSCTCRAARPVALLLAVASGYAAGVVEAPGAYRFGWALPALVVPSWDDILRACARARGPTVLPQIPLTLTNAVIVTAALSRRLFPEPCARTSERNLSLSTGVANLALTPFGALPMCHGAGGLQAQYPFGARSGAAPVILGIILLAHGRRVRPGQRRARCGVAV